MHVRREVLSRDATVVLCYPWWPKYTRWEIICKKAPSTTSDTDLNNDNLSNPSLILLLARDQLRLPKYGHRKFIPKQLRFREWSSAYLASQDSCKVVSQIFQGNVSSSRDPEFDLSVDKRRI